MHARVYTDSPFSRADARMKVRLLRWSVGLLLLGMPTVSPAASLSAPAYTPDLCYTGLVRSVPRPLQIHVVMARLGPEALTVRAVVASDPDGPGPAETALANPLKLATAAGAVGAINANVFSRIPTKVAAGTSPPPWTNGLPVTIGGWVRTAGSTRSGPSSLYAPVWLGADGRVHAGDTNVPPTAPEAVAGFTVILRDGKPLRPGGARAAALHPRSAVGVDRTGRRLWLVVVDGRQPGQSEGMTEAELGLLLQELGATDAVNLDGGGSSILLGNTDGNGLSVLNRPCEGHPRPIAVLLGLFRAAQPGTRP